MEPKDIREALAGIDGYDLLVIDTPPSIEDHPEVFKMLIVVTHLAIIPTGQSSDDVDIVLPWDGVHAEVRRQCLVCAQSREAAHPRIYGTQTKLLKVGRICAVELPDYEDVQFSASRGLGLLELRNAKGGEHITGIWSFVAQELGFSMSGFKAVSKAAARRQIVEDPRIEKIANALLVLQPAGIY